MMDIPTAIKELQDQLRKSLLVFYTLTQLDPVTNHLHFIGETTSEDGKVVDIKVKIEHTQSTKY